MSLCRLFPSTIRAIHRLAETGCCTSIPEKTDTATVRVHNTSNDTLFVNRSPSLLTQNELSVLDKGLTFVSTECRPNKKRLVQEFDEFTRLLRVKFYMANPEEENGYVPHPFKLKTHWQPSKTKNLTLESFIDNTTQAFLKCKPNRNIHSNLPRADSSALESLGERSDTIIKKADKGSLVVVEDRKSYTKQGLEHVQNPNVYTPLKGDPTPYIVREINDTLKTLYDMGLFDKETYNFLVKDPKKVRTQQLYFLTKLHKNPVAFRPIVSGSSGPTEAISKFIDYILKPIVCKQSSYVPDSGSFVKYIENHPLPDNIKLVSIDVTSLYTNIPQEPQREGSRHIQLSTTTQNILTPIWTNNTLSTPVYI